MFRVSLVNMPFASVTMPSLALTQLKSVLEEHFKDQIRDAENSGLGDWFFRQDLLKYLIRALE